MKSRISVIVAVALLALATPLLATRSGVAAEIEPGPEDAGLRLRLVVEPKSKSDAEGFTVRVDLLNTSQRTIKLQGAWEGDETGDVKEYLEAATSIESVPAIEPWKGGIAGRVAGRDAPQPTHALEAGKTLSLRWETKGRQLKNRVSDPTVVQNPTFPVAGLYSVHANLDVVTADGTVRLRSNEQLVSVGGSRQMPKHTFGPLWNANLEKQSGTLGLGSLHKVEVGDRFAITSKLASWRLTVTEVQPRYSEVKLELLGNGPSSSVPKLPDYSTSATLVRDSP